ncbi:MAG: hypothetical protein LPK45_12410, partial [Bacteroidota bacterium]|nr:hypothetical protein [Bacteroidota bacterium]MDX5431912.1 hypothetical protein [Bacteroidota bacterium]MDX5470626.1 hypothetical protein [Bacteroidota bacterium]
MQLSFRQVVWLRVSGLLATIVAGVLVWDLGGYEISTGIIALLLALQVFDMIRYVEHANRRVLRMIESIENDDFSVRFPHRIKGMSF